MKSMEEIRDLVEGIKPLLIITARMYLVYVEEGVPPHVAENLTKHYITISFAQQQSKQDPEQLLEMLKTFGSGSA